MTMYVRGKYELAELDEDAHPTGHRLTEFEVREAYGNRVIAELRTDLSAVLLSSRGNIEKAIRDQRAAIGISVGSLARATDFDEGVIRQVEENAAAIPIQHLEQIAFILGLDERFLALEEDARADRALRVRLRVLLQEAGAETAMQRRRITPQVALKLSEAASITRTQIRLQKWLDIPDEKHQFATSSDYGDVQHPAWKVGYQLAEQARSILELGRAPITSMRALVERRIGIPVLQFELPSEIAGATVASGADRGIALNLSGQNTNVWVRRATLAHELGHILFDPDEQLNSIRVDRYSEAEKDPESPGFDDYAEQRANAFSIAFIAPPEGVRERITPPASSASVIDMMHHYGLGRVAATYHVANVFYRQYDAPSASELHAGPRDEQIAAESFTIDFFQPAATPVQRRGRFAVLVTKAFDAGLIAEDSAAAYLRCSTNELQNNLGFLRDIASGE